MKVGVSLLFKEKSSSKIKGILKSVIVDSDNISKSIKSVSEEISNYYSYEYIGINDLFSVSGDAEVGEVLGRTTFYTLNNFKQAKSLVNNKKILLNEDFNSKLFNCSLIYLCQNEDGEKYTISIISMVKSNKRNVIVDAEKLAEDSDLIKRIKLNSLENLQEIKFVGVETVCAIDFKFNVFQSFYSDFKNTEALNQELLSDKEIKEILEDILRH